MSRQLRTPDLSESLMLGEFSRQRRRRFRWYLLGGLMVSLAIWAFTIYAVIAIWGPVVNS